MKNIILIVLVLLMMSAFVIKCSPVYANDAEIELEIELITLMCDFALEEITIKLATDGIPKKILAMSDEELRNWCYKASADLISELAYNNILTVEEIEILVQKFADQLYSKIKFEITRRMK